MFSEGSGIRLVVKALDAIGAFQNSENLSTPPKIVCQNLSLLMLFLNGNIMKFKD